MEFPNVFLEVANFSEPANLFLFSTKVVLGMVSLLEWTRKELLARIDTLALLSLWCFGLVTLIVVVVLALTLSKSASLLGCGPRGQPGSRRGGF